ncbi:MAG: Helicase associated domain protein, partial [Bacilli bacterium]|nr:Helicase associated domain protein [Bacilli bacterium]
YIPITYITENGENLGRWVNSQRHNYKNGRLTEERLNKLNNLDRTWLEKTISSTSFPEQAILFYVQKIFPNATKYKSKDISEIDIFIPELRVGIEYDGFYHKNISKDIYKTKKCLENNINLIRVR